jgi:hypothetical protein
MRWTFLALSMLVACSGGDPGKDDDTSGTDDTAPDTDTVDDSVAPEIVSIDLVQCTTQQSAGEVWQLQLTVDDPQGNDTISGGTVSVQNEAGGELAAYDIACNSGTCIGSIRADYDGITCSLEGSVAFVFQITDEDGNSSAPATYGP